MDLCSANTFTLVGVIPSSTMVRPIAPCTTISAAINQWNACATLPQRVSVLRSMTGLLLHRGLVFLLRVLIQDRFDFQSHLNPQANRFRKRSHAKCRAIKHNLRGGEPRDRLQP